MNPVAVMRAARGVRDELDSLMGGASGELRDRLDPLLAEAGSRPPGQLADAVIALVAEYGPAWERLTALLSLDRGLTAEQVLPMLSQGPGAAPQEGGAGPTPPSWGAAPPQNGTDPSGWDPDDFPSTASHTPDWMLPDAGGQGRPMPGSGQAPQNGSEAAYDDGYGDMPSTGAMSTDWMHPDQAADPAAPSSPPSREPQAASPETPQTPPEPPSRTPQAPSPRVPPPQTPASAPPEPAPAPADPPAAPPPAEGRGPSVLNRLTGAFRRRRKEPPAPAPGPEWEGIPLIEAPAEAVAGWGAEVTIGVAPGPGRNGTATPREPIDLDIQVVAEGFDAPGGWRVRLRADKASSYPGAVVNLVALAQEEPEAARQIQVTYAVRGQVIGFGLRAVTVHGSPGSLGGHEALEPVSGTRIRPALMGEPADVTAIIVHGDRPGRLWWTYQSPHFVTPDRAERCDLGTRASEFGRHLTGRGRLSEDLGREVGSRVPWGFWDLLNAVAGRVAPRRPNVLILSQEPHVPWELAVLEQPYDPSLPPYLNCQTVTGRWPLGGRRPELPPPANARADRVAVVYGEAQAHPLVTEYGATQVSPALGDVLGVLGQGPDIIHFTDGGSASEALGYELPGAPFVFLEEPGDTQAFLIAGASGVVAPLWPAGGGLAPEFYRRCFAGEPPAEVLRSMRAQAPDSAGAYRFHGHPALTLRRTAPPAG
ncbi:hypothetical protein OG339_15670 [Streptosporangium sp. NBC_01495]|uniref:hypothetical protein n=1 Tax=Streptosporangium sp. NBC_01495 TaxID=2903899 RepID=UPI002E346DC0|nr:hypothetical protein [Streptosporangium sp. NBC_01495]